MDDVNTAASIISIIDVAETVIGYIRNVRYAVVKRDQLLREVSTTVQLLYLLIDKARTAEGCDIKSLSEPDGPLSQFRSTLEFLTSRLKPSKWPVIKHMRRLEKAGAEKEFDQALSTLDRQNSLFSIALLNEPKYFSLNSNPNFPEISIQV